MNSILDIIKSIKLNTLVYNKNIDKYNIYIVHYDKLFERKKELIEQFKINEIDENKYEFITEYKRENLLQEDLNIFDIKKLRAGTIAITLTHLLAYVKLIVSDKGICLILEDDVILDFKFKIKLEKYLRELPQNWDILFIGDGCNLHIQKEVIEKNPNKHIFLKCNEPTDWGGNGATRCTDSYIINKRAAVKIIEYVKKLNSPIYLPVDWWLNEVIRDLNLIVYWAEPTIVTQGTQNGKYKTSH